MKEIFRNRSGFSLIELIQALVIFSVVMAIVFGLFVQVSRTLQKREARQQLLDEVNSVMNFMAERISNSSGWISGDTLSIRLIGKNGLIARLYWNPKDSLIYYGEKPLSDKGTKVTKCGLTYLPPNDSLQLCSKEEWFDELDSDRNGTLELMELKRASNIEISLITLAKDQQVFLKSTVRLPRPVADTANMGY
jgi:prepilin-type N-terminal cleavage/methylation domain-containing protein